MSTVSPTLEEVHAPRTLVGPRLGLLALVLVAAVLLQTTLMVGLRVADGIPDLVAVTVAAGGALRGPLVGGVAGFMAGLMVELTSPTGTLGVLALAMLLCGAWCGRAAIEPSEGRFLAPLGPVRLAVGILIAEITATVMHGLLGTGLPLTQLVPRFLLPTLLLSLAIAPPVILALRGLLGGPRVVEPGGGA